MKRYRKKMDELLLALDEGLWDWRFFYGKWRISFCFPAKYPFYYHKGADKAKPKQMIIMFFWIEIFIIDWSKIAIAPPERDLVCLVRERFELFLTHYARACQRPPRLHPEIFEYYVYYLILGGITDYGSWILLEDASLAETQYAWEKFEQHLPIDHQRAQAELDEISRVIHSTDSLFPRAE